MLQYLHVHYNKTNCWRREHCMCQAWNMTLETDFINWTYCCIVVICCKYIFAHLPKKNQLLVWNYRSSLAVCPTDHLQIQNFRPLHDQCCGFLVGCVLLFAQYLPELQTENLQLTSSSAEVMFLSFICQGRNLKPSVLGNLEVWHRQIWT